MTTWMNHEGIMLRKFRQRKTITISSHLYVTTKKKKLIAIERGQEEGQNG